jgi:hypothetical protein
MQWVKRIENLDVRYFCTQGIVGADGSTLLLKEECDNHPQKRVSNKQHRRAVRRFRGYDDK